MEEISEYRLILTTMGQHQLTTWALYHFDDNGIGRFLQADEVAPFDTFHDILTRVARIIRGDAQLRTKLR